MIKVSLHQNPSYWNRRVLCTWTWQAQATLNIDEYGSKVVKKSSRLFWESVEMGVFPPEIKSILWPKWHQWMIGLGIGVEVGETSQSDVYTSPNLNQTNFGKCFVADAESWQQFV